MPACQAMSCSGTSCCTSPCAADDEVRRRVRARVPEPRHGARERALAHVDDDEADRALRPRAPACSSSSPRAGSAAARQPRAPREQARPSSATMSSRGDPHAEKPRKPRTFVAKIATPCARRSRPSQTLDVTSVSKLVITHGIAAPVGAVLSGHTPDRPTTEQAKTTGGWCFLAAIHPGLRRPARLLRERIRRPRLLRARRRLR